MTGGIDSVIRGIAKWAPDDIEVSIIGLTMNHSERPVGHWTSVRLGRKTVPFLPVGRLGQAMQRGRIPYSVRLAWGLLRFLRKISTRCDLFDFHRIEVAFPLLCRRQPKNLFVHQNMEMLRNAQADIGWRLAPSVYFALERRVLPRFARIFCVRSDAAEAYKTKYPELAGRISFFPTWMDPEIFYAPSAEGRRQLRNQISEELGLDRGAEWLISVGRLDRQKNPLLMVKILALLQRRRPQARLIVVGDGVLRSQVEAQIAEEGLLDTIVMVGAKSPKEVARYLMAADVYLMTSAYEGMPISVLEGMGTGLPVVSTKVGEVPRVVHSGLNGEVVEGNDAGLLANAVINVLGRPMSAQREASLNLVSDFVPSKVLAPLYDYYRQVSRDRSTDGVL